jgi:SAM-dependent methyltransferase
MPYSRRARFYDIEYAECRDVGFIRSLINDGVTSVLEVPCGAGRVSKWIAREISELTIVDIEPEMVARAAETAARSGHGVNLSGEVCDMLNLALAQRFDLAIMPREALQLLPPMQGARALAAVGSHVVSGGHLFLDLATFSGHKKASADPDYYDPTRRDGTWEIDFTRRLADGARLTRRSAQYHDGNSILFELQHEIDRPGLQMECWASQMRLHRYERSWIDTTVPKGMTLEAVYGDYDRSKFSNMSPRMLVLYRNDGSKAR